MSKAMETTEVGMAIVTGKSRVAVAPKAHGSAVSVAMGDVLAERKRQDATWGEQNHPIVPRDITERAMLRRMSAGSLACMLSGIDSATTARMTCEHEHAQGRGTYASILVEEVAELVEAAALHGDASDEARAEAVQVAAVALAIVECIDRKRGAK